MRTGIARTGLLAILFALLALTAAACSGGSDDSDSNSSSEPTAATTTGGGAAAGDDAAAGMVKGQPVADFFKTNCTACHGVKRQGGVGPELTPRKLTKDNAFYEDTVLNGRSGTAMPAWSKTASLSQDDARVLVLWLKTVAP